MIAVIEIADCNVCGVLVFRDEHRDAAALKFAELVAEDIEQGEEIAHDAALDRAWAHFRESSNENNGQPWYSEGGSCIEYLTDNVYLHGEP